MALVHNINKIDERPSNRCESEKKNQAHNTGFNSNFVSNAMPITVSLPVTAMKFGAWISIQPITS